MGDVSPVMVRAKNASPDEIMVNDLLLMGIWMRDLCADLDALAERTYRKPLPAILEIKKPRSSPSHKEAANPPTNSQMPQIETAL